MKKCRNKVKVNAIDKMEYVDSLFCGKINVVTEKDHEWLTEVCLEKSKTVRMKIDSGTQCNVMQYEKYTTWKIKAPIEKANTKLSNYNGSKIEVIGKCKIHCVNRLQTNNRFLISVVKSTINAPVILELQTIQSMNLVRRIDTVKIRKTKAMEENRDLFEGWEKLRILNTKLN